MDYLEINRESWNKRTLVHVDSEFYDNKSFIAGRSSLNPFELELLGDVKGKSILHLQCHFGQDSISLARTGADVTAVDLSDEAISKAKELALETKTEVDFVCCDVYSAKDHVKKQFDIVFCSYGTIGWLPDLEKWAGVVEHMLKPGGKVILVEFHPVVWMFDDDFKELGYSYFNVGPIIETSSGTYTDNDAPIKQEYVTWNHPLEEVIGSLLRSGLSLQNFKEYDYSPYNCFKHTIEFEPGKFRIEHCKNHLPMVYSVVFEKGTRNK